MLVSFLSTHFPTEIRGASDGAAAEKKLPSDWVDDGTTEYSGRFHTDAPVLVDRELVDAREELIKKVCELQLPGNVLDSLIDGLGGADQVAELTGRSGRIVRRGNRLVYESRGSTASRKGTSLSGENDVIGVNISEKNAFMQGKKLVAIISDAASTGISLHASQGAKNTRRRTHITIELRGARTRRFNNSGERIVRIKRPDPCMSCVRRISAASVDSSPPLREGCRASARSREAIDERRPGSICQMEILIHLSEDMR